MLNPSDVYVEGGSNNLLACWTDKVTKYDASSFYNWEQDNLPLHDLDERTHLLWEKLGHPTSALTGMSFIVSADATSSCNPLYFTTLSSCIAALPEVINYPILIEVASFGNLGGLDISNKSFGPRGALEIVNRNSASQGGLSNNTGKLFGSFYNDSDLNNGIFSSLIPGANDATAVGFYLATVGAVAGSASPTIAFDSMRARLLTRDENDNEILIASSAGSNTEYADVRFRNPYVFAKRSGVSRFSRLTASLSSTEIPWDTTPTIARDLSSFRFVPFERNSTSDMRTYDASTVDQLDNSEIIWGDTDENIANIQNAAAGVAYFNSLEYIKVKNCDGPIYLRNLNVDAQHNRDNGIEIINSNVVLERSAASRANKAGLFCKNSNVIITRGFVGYRNYKVEGGSRVGIPYTNKRNIYQTMDDYGAGIYALNSTLNFSSTYLRDTNEYVKLITTDASSIYSDYFGSFGGLFSSIQLPHVVNESIYCLSRNDIGIHCVNSNIIGGTNELQSYSGADAIGQERHITASVFNCELNTEAGIRLDNSVIDYAGRVLLDGNYFGLDSINSEIKVNTLTARYNQSTGIKLNNSKFIYNKDLYNNYVNSTKSFVETMKIAQVAGIRNGQDIFCNNSVISPLYTSSMPSIYGMVYTSGSFGLDESPNKLLPSVHIKGGSEVDFIHAHMVRVPGENLTTQPQYGLIARVEDESSLTVRGSKEFANIILGPRTRGDSVKVAGVYVDKGSTFKIQGPTTIGRFGIDVLAENSSNIEITPLQSNNGSLLVSSFNLDDPANHSTVELHSTRACLVANRNSNILMENLGDYQEYYINGPYGTSIPGPRDYQIEDYKTYASAGYLQFYPNANLNHGSVVADPANVQSPAYVFDDGAVGQPSKYYLIHTLGNPITNISTGGMCVRAVENSLVQANNVHFPATWHNTSGLLYDIDGTAPLAGNNCTRLFIWNIADNSLLKASNLIVSGLYPRDASGYYGPSGQWGDVSAAPSSTPDTSSLSILDYYGRSTDNPFGKSASGENFGPFRLYFSTDSITDFMIASGTNALEGYARQVFAQGYNFSGNLIVSSNGIFLTSSEFVSTLQRDKNNLIQPSGFYYASAMVFSPNTIKAVLDDSALNTFANAKHNTVGKSGLAKVVKGYLSASGFGGESYNDYDYGKGIASINNFDLKKDN